MFGESKDKFEEAIHVTDLFINSKKETLALTFATLAFFAGWIMAVLMAKGLDSLMDRTQE